MNSLYQRKLILIGLVLYTFLIIYGSLFPIEQWNWDLGSWSAFLTLNFPQNNSKTDFVINLIIYIPLGFFLFYALNAIKRLFIKMIIITLIAFFLSTTLEYLQQFLPGRTSSLLDILLNTVGAILGIIAAYILSHKKTQLYFSHWKHKYLSHTPYSLLGVAAVLLWAASQLAPFFPSISINNLRHGFSPLWYTLNSPDSLILSKLIISSFNISAIFLILRASLKKKPHSTQLIFLFILGILLLKIPIVSIQLSLETCIAFIIGMLVYGILHHLNVRTLKAAALILLLLAYSYASLLPGYINLPTQSMNWIPFSQQMNTLAGINDLLKQLGLFSAFAFLLSPRSLPPVKHYFLLAGGFIFSLVFTIEWLQQYIPGRSSDITDVIIAFSTWTVCILYPWNTDTMPDTNNKIQARKTFSFKLSYLFSALIVISLVMSLSFFIRGPIRTYYHYDLPEISELPNVKLPNFKQAHPRLPAPTVEDIFFLEANNKGFFNSHKQRAKAKKGNFYSRILIEHVYPGTVDIDKLFEDVINLTPSWRGHEQTKPIALAYDWLYYQWSTEQRIRLRRKLQEACDYQIYAIRDKFSLSPYNVYLYNSPFQALIAASLALHGDIPEAEDNCMRFTHDYWTNRVVPVWQQVMGKNGGWHEGGEYIGIGIGQAVYQVPAMWKNATGEDYFSRIPGIPGFLDFLVYRTRPDGSHFRWGDSLHFNKSVPDRIPLALEYQHKAAFNLKPEKNIKPTSWPWGPISDIKLIDTQAKEELPLTKFFDGVGLLVSRSSWDRDATYVTFKAGNNYWSHTHLDQGAFTIFKGGALAIDSGLYGPNYGSNHHINYTYQSIAHNVITITDPDDTIPKPPRQKGKKGRKIANDGGQRRVGSWWGKSAPLDLQDWINQSEIYHTAAIEKIIEKDDITIISADLTPAYNNVLSGEDTFAHRTKRVNKYQRVFIHDKRNDVILVFDKVNAYKASFRKKWLLHSLLEPTIKQQYFQLSTPEKPKLKMKGGILKGKILLPEKFYVNKIGGRGFEFYVDNKNYDENGEVMKTSKRKNGTEPGAWRIELEPLNSQKEDIFLVAMQASLQPEDKPLPTITIQQDDTQIICEVQGENKLTIVFPENLEKISYSTSPLNQ